MADQLDLFGEVAVAIGEPEPAVEVHLGRHSARIPLRSQRKKAVTRLMQVLEELEGKDVYVSSYDAGGRHFTIDNLKLPRLQLEWHPHRLSNGPNYVPGVIALRGSRGAHVRIFTDYLVDFREQEYLGYWLYLLDFRNGFWDSKLDMFRSHYACLHIARFKD